MAAQQSAAALFQRSAGEITGRLSAIDADSLDMDGRQAVKTLRRTVADTRLDLRDYEYADTAAEAARHARAARARLTTLRSLVLAAGESGIFGAADVAQLTAQFDAVADKLQ